MIFDIAVFVIVIFARRITTAWHDHRALLDAANLIAALAIAAIAGIALNAVLPGKDYEFGTDVTEGRSADMGRY